MRFGFVCEFLCCFSLFKSSTFPWIAFNAYVAYPHKHTLTNQEEILMGVCGLVLMGCERGTVLPHAIKSFKCGDELISVSANAQRYDGECVYV